MNAALTHRSAVSERLAFTQALPCYRAGPRAPDPQTRERSSCCGVYTGNRRRDERRLHSLLCTTDPTGNRRIIGAPDLADAVAAPAPAIRSQQSPAAALPAGRASAENAGPRTIEAILSSRIVCLALRRRAHVCRHGPHRPSALACSVERKRALRAMRHAVDPAGAFTRRDVVTPARVRLEQCLLPTDSIIRRIRRVGHRLLGRARTSRSDAAFFCARTCPSHGADVVAWARARCRALPEHASRHRDPRVRPGDGKLVRSFLSAMSARASEVRVIR